MRIAKIKITPTATGFLVSGTVKGKMRRKRLWGEGAEQLAFNTKQNWESEIADMPKAPMTVTRLTEAQCEECEGAYQRLVGKPFSLAQAVEYTIANYKPTDTTITFLDALTKFLDDKQRANKRPRTVTNLRVRLSQFAKDKPGLTVAGIGQDAVRAFINRDGVSTRNRINDTLALTNFFNWSVKRDYCQASPMVKLERLEADDIEPEAMSLAQVRKLLSAAMDFKNSVLVPYVTLSLFCAIRPAEVERLTWANVDLEAKTVEIGGAIAKMRSRRVVEISDNAVEFLRPFATRNTSIAGVNFRKDWDAVREQAGLLADWVPDWLRHTGISFHLARGKSDSATAAWAGNSPDIIHKHYKGLVKPKDMAEFWNILPNTLIEGPATIPLPILQPLALAVGE